MAKSMSYKINVSVPTGFKLSDFAYFNGEVVFAGGKIHLPFRAHQSVLGWTIEITAGSIRSDFQDEIERAVKTAVEKMPGLPKKKSRAKRS